MPKETKTSFIKTFRVPPSLHKKAREYAEENGMDLCTLSRMALIEFLERRKRLTNREWRV